MTRTRTARMPTAILTGDIHLREDQPVCRIDDYREAQARKIAWLRNLQATYGCPIFDSGDMFQHWKPSPHLLQWAIHQLPDKIITVPGNHDLPSHSIELYEKSGLAVLEAAGVVTIPPFFDHLMLQNSICSIRGFPWGQQLDPAERMSYRQVALCHVMTYTGALPYPGCTDSDAHALLRKMKGFDLVVTGHNHIPFVVELDGRLLVNPGSLMRSTAIQADHKPRVYLWYAEDNTVEPVFIPIEEGVVSREHIEVQEYRDERSEAFVKSLSNDFEIGLSFESNLEQHFATNRTRARTESIVWAAVKGA